MTFRRCVSGLVLFGLAFGFLFAMVGLTLSGPAIDTFIGGGIVFLFGNLAAAATLTGLYVLDISAAQKSFGIRNLTPAGWGLVIVMLNLTAIVAIAAPPKLLTLLSLPRISAIFVLLPVFLVGWFLLSRFGVRVWRSNPP